MFDWLRRNRRKRRAALEVRLGDYIVTDSGICGVVTSYTPEYVTLRSGPGEGEITLVRASIRALRREAPDARRGG